MTVRVGVNGFGRIGRLAVRAALERHVTVVGINDLADAGTLAHLLRYDSTYGRFPAEVGVADGRIVVGGVAIRTTAERDPAELDWGAVGADVVIESTGRFRTRDDAARHLKGGAAKVIVSAPGKGVDATLVMGVNHSDYDPDRHDVVSNASCTTNCVVPMVKVLHVAIGAHLSKRVPVDQVRGQQHRLVAGDARRRRQRVHPLGPAKRPGWTVHADRGYAALGQPLDVCRVDDGRQHADQRLPPPEPLDLRRAEPAAEEHLDVEGNRDG